MPDLVQKILRYLEEIGPDPDEARELRPEFVEELRAQIARHEEGTAKLYSIEEVKHELGLE